LVPTGVSIFFSLMAIAAVITKHDKQSLYMLVILGLQAALFSSLFYFIAWAVSRLLCRVIPERLMAAVVVGIAMAFFAASVFNIYRLPGHNSAPPGNILDILRGK
jgi:cell shape-determining protein MreD